MTEAGRVWTVAHRGASQERPENTPAAFDEALRQGCDGIELDVQLSADGCPVVYHDRTLNRAGGGRRRVASLDVEQLRGLPAGAWFDPRYAAETIPTLDEVLQRYARRTRLLIEIKLRRGPRGAPDPLALADAVASCIRERRLQRRVFVLCFDRTVLRRLERVAPAIPRVLNLKPPRTRPRSMPRLCEGLSALSADVSSLTPRFADAVHEQGLPLFVYTCNRPGQVRRALQCEARAIMSDRPAWLAQRIRESD